MLHELSIEMRFVLCSLATWRLTHLFVAEDGPWDIIVRLRAKLGESMAGRMMDCFHCLSAWIAIPFAFVNNSRCPNLDGVLAGDFWNGITP